jgi:transposase
VLESTRNWYWMADDLQECGIDLLLANPKQTKAIAWARVKTDKVDADTLNMLLRADVVPTCYLAPAKVRQKRELLRYRAALVRTRTGVKNRIHALVDRYGVSHAFRDLFGRRGREFLGSLVLPAEARRALEGHLRLVAHLDGLIGEADGQIQKEFVASREARQLDTIPGVGVLWGLLIAYEVGNIDRFRSAAAFCAYCGLVPTVSSSGGREYRGGISKQTNPWLRWAFVEAANAAVRRPSDTWHYTRYHKLRRNKGHQKAAVALAREFAVSAYYMLQRNEPYRELRSRSGGDSNPSRTPAAERSNHAP